MLAKIKRSKNFYPRYLSFYFCPFLILQHEWLGERRSKGYTDSQHWLTPNPSPSPSPQTIITRAPPPPADGRAVTLNMEEQYCDYYEGQFSDADEDRLVYMIMLLRDYII